MNYWNDIKDFFINNGWKIITVLALIVIGMIFIKIICRSLRRVFAKKNVDTIVSYFITTIINIVLIIILIVAVFDMLGISIAPFVAILGTLGLALALSIQDSLSNIASGIVIITTKPFKKGDYVSISGTEGSVSKMKMLTTELFTIDNKRIILSNNKVAKSDIINYTDQQRRRLDLKFNVAYGSNLEEVKTVLGNVISNHPSTINDPPPLIRLMEHASSSLLFITRTWVNTADYWSTYYDIQEQVYNALYDNNIEIPYNKLDVNILKDKNDKT